MCFGNIQQPVFCHKMWVGFCSGAGLLTPRRFPLSVEFRCWWGMRGVNIASLPLGMAECRDHPSARIKKACELVIFVRWWSAASCSYAADTDPN